MNKRIYKITIVNGGGYEIYTITTNAENENQALMQTLKDVIINDGDTITIEEIEKDVF